jgi:hypothetical protein
MECHPCVRTLHAFVPRSTIAVAARPLIDKKVLLEQLHRCLESQI